MKPIKTYTKIAFTEPDNSDMQTRQNQHDKMINTNKKLTNLKKK